MEGQLKQLLAISLLAIAVTHFVQPAVADQTDKLIGLGIYKIDIHWLVPLIVPISCRNH
jgi:hypothetical protein